MRRAFSALHAKFLCRHDDEAEVAGTTDEAAERPQGVAESFSS